MSARRLRGSSTALLFFIGLVGCSTGSEPQAVVRVTVSPGATLLTSPGAVATFSATTFDGGGNQVAGVVAWSSDDVGVATVDASTGVVTAVAAGITSIRAQSGETEGAGRVEVYIQPDWEFAVGESIFGRNGYVEYIVGDLPLVISAPHGGSEEPDEVGRRTFGVLGQDRMTQEMARAIISEIIDRTGKRPHVIINRLHRNRLDANREIVEAAQADPFAEQAWFEYSELIDSAKARVTAATGTGLFVDLHGHGHDLPRVELGYLLSADDLGQTDGALDSGSFAANSSLRRLAGVSPLPFSQLLRGPESMGGMLGDVGVRAIPSPDDPAPLGAPYFTGGYNTRTHGSLTGGRLDGIQFELQWPGVRESEQDRAQFAQAFASAVERYIETHFALPWRDPVP